MNKKITVLVLMLASLAIFLPSQGNAATSETTGSVKTAAELNAAAQVRVQIGNRRNNRRVNRRINRQVRRQVRRNNRPRVRQQVYYRNGRSLRSHRSRLLNSISNTIK